MQRDPRSFLWDVREHADIVGAVLRGKTLDDYKADILLRSTVERQFTIIGEALNQLAKVAPQLAARIPELPQVVAFRNVLIHGYDQVIDSVVWRTAQEHLPALRARAAALLSELGDAP